MKLPTDMPPQDMPATKLPVLLSLRCFWPVEMGLAPVPKYEDPPTLMESFRPPTLNRPASCLVSIAGSAGWMPVAPASWRAKVRFEV